MPNKPLLEKSASTHTATNANAAKVDKHKDKKLTHQQGASEEALTDQGKPKSVKAKSTKVPNAKAGGSQGKETGQAKRKAFAMHRADHDPRAAALVAITRVLQEGQSSQEALDTLLATHLMVPTDKRLCTELVYGTLRYYSRLLWFVSRCLTKPEKLPQEMIYCLVLALYEMTFLRIPHHASVGWAVSHIRNRFGLGLSKVTNGTLRTVQRRLRDFHSPEFYDETFPNKNEALSHRFSIPVWIVDLWVGAYGLEQAEILLASSLESAPSGLRLNIQKDGWESYKQELLESPFTPKKLPKHLVKNSLKEKELQTELPPQKAMLNTLAQDEVYRLNGEVARLNGEVLLTGEEAEAHILEVGQAGLAFVGTLPWQGRSLEKQGGASRQSMASYSALGFFNPKTWPQPLWDCCAGRGGKSLALLEMDVPVALASDLSSNRLKGFAMEYARLGLSNQPCPTLVVESAAELFAKYKAGTLRNIEGVVVTDLPQKFGTILIDAPCSGLGTLSRHPEIKYRRTKDDVADLVRIQRKILEAALPMLADGGLIIYLTCTLNPEENQMQIEKFLQAHPELSLLESFSSEASSPFKEFFYGAKLQKKSGA